jgi:hypothetical protein
MDENIARHIIERYFLGAHGTITQIELELQGSIALVFVDSEEWLVSQISPFQYCVKSDAYNLYEVDARNIPTSVLRPDGVAVLSNGQLFRLKLEEEFQAFWQQVWEKVTPIELAELLSRYQGSGKNLERHQNLVFELKDLLGLLKKEQIDAIDNLIPFKISQTNFQIFCLEFCTFYIARTSPDNCYRVSINRWQVNQDKPGQLSWTIQLIAHEMDSPRYSSLI